mmetsp:Transcript_135882/g.344016  ORF Transcript_135882/g.344016 Transcript_135882/m.344016 type:complete len:426 (+) Transcript_135882:110-1387(+)
MTVDTVSDGKMALSLDVMLGDVQQHARISQGSENFATPQRKSFLPYHSQTVPKYENLSAVNGLGEQPVTTMMLRNIPNRYTQNTLLEEIDNFGFFGSYDFFYLPMDVHNRSNVGYAFINFLAPTDAERFRRVFGDHRFQKFQSRKISSVCSAHVQGIDENLKHFENRAVTHARNDQYRPIVFKGNQRVDFEEAVAEVKARTSGRVAASRPKPAAASHEARSRADTAPPGLAEADLGERGGFRRRITPPTPPPPGLDPIMGEGLMHCGMQSGRQGLEAAIADYLMSHQVAGGSVEPVPLATKNLSGVVPGCSSVPPMHVGAGLPGTACPGELPGSCGMQANEVNQLLSLRSMLVQSLRKRDVLPQQGMSAPAYEGPAYVKLPSSSGFYGKSFDLRDESGCITPRTNALMLGSALDRVLPEEPRFLH